MSSNMELIKVLVVHGANVNGRSRSGTPLLYAARFSGSEGVCDAMGFLLDSGADPNLPDYEGETALAIATRKNNAALTELLRSHGAKLSETPSYADLEHACDNNDTPALKNLLAKLPRDSKLVNKVNENGAGLLWGAAAQNRPEVVKLLLECGADPNIKTDNRETPLHEAAAHSADSSVAEQEEAVEIAAMLLSKGADVNAKTNEGVTPLQFAKVNRQYKMVDLLQRHGGHE